MKTAVVYARYSSDNQTEQSIEGQLRVCEQYAKNNNILILNTYIDRAMTGTNDNRPDFQQMIKDSAKKEWQYVLVYKIDRFSRNKYETAKYKKILKDNGVKLLSAMENIPDTPEGIILESLLEGMAEYYSAELAQKVRRGLNESRIKGNYTGGPIPFGYKLAGKKIVINEENASVLQYIFTQYAKDISVGKIIDNLSLSGIFYKNKPFKKTTIYKLLRNRKYIGEYVVNNKMYENMYPQIIDKQLFEKVQKKAEMNQYGKNSVKNTYLFKNKLKCGYCGMPISAESGTSQNGHRFNYYKCLGIKKYRNGCQKETIPQEILESFLMNVIMTQMANPKIIDLIVNNLMMIQNQNVDTSSKLNMLIKNKRQAENALNNIMLAVEQGIMNKTTNKRMEELEMYIENLEKEILIEKHKTNAKISENEIRHFYTQAMTKEPKILIEYLIKEIQLFNDKIEITFNSPSIQNGDCKGCSFLTIKSDFNKSVQHHGIITSIIEISFYI